MSTTYTVFVQRIVSSGDLSEPKPDSIKTIYSQEFTEFDERAFARLLNKPTRRKTTKPKSGPAQP